MNVTDHLIQQIVRLHHAGKGVQHIARACGKTTVYVQQILDQKLGKRPNKGRRK